MSYKIGSFNIENLGLGALDTKEDERKDRDLKKIAEIIRKENFDIVALQEIKSEGKAFWSSGTSSKQGILYELGRNWEFWPTKDNNVRGNPEFAFVWRKDRVKLSEGENPCLAEYKKRGDSIELIRNPVIARFTPLLLPKMEIRLIDVHLYFGDSKKENKGDRLDRRKKEFDTMIREILNKYDDKRYGDNKQSFTFAIGDYNLNLPVIIPDGRDFEALIGREKKVGDKVYKTVQEALTTVHYEKEKKEEDSGNVGATVENVKNEKVADDIKSIAGQNANYWCNNYDHASYNEEYDKKAIITCNRINVIAKYCGNNCEYYEEKVSDHVPIALVIDLL